MRRTVEAAIELGIPYLTLYSFSSENWSRPAEEIDDLMGLMKRFIRRDLAELHQDDVRIRVIGERDNVETEMMALIDEAWELTRDNTGLTLVIAFNYGARAEIAAAARRSPRRSRPARSSPRTSTSRRWTARSTPPAFPIPTFSSAPAARCASRTSCCGRRLYRVRLPRRLLAGLRPGAARGSHRPLSAPRAPLRRPLEAIAG